MENKTALQELKDKLQVVVDELNDAMPDTQEYGYRLAMENVIKDIDAQMLKKERNKIELAYNQGDSDRDNQQDGNGRGFRNCIDYYNKTYKPINSNKKQGSIYTLKYCPKCIQMTNHIGDGCLKCTNSKPISTTTPNL